MNHKYQIGAWPTKSINSHELSSKFEPVQKLMRVAVLVNKQELVPDYKVLFLSGELFVLNRSCAEMKAEHLRKFQKFGVSRWSEMAFSEFLSQGPTRKRQNK
jgi:hypothetical protein